MDYITPAGPGSKSGEWLAQESHVKGECGGTWMVMAWGGRVFSMLDAMRGLTFTFEGRVMDSYKAP